MKDSNALPSGETINYRRLVLPLTGAVLISAVGFGLILLLIGWLIHLQSIHPHGFHSAIIPLWAFSTVVFSLSAMIRASLKRRIDRKKPSDSKQAVLPL
jgi:multisubunit Na+/H+ antiporter MnhG subunit